MSIPVIVGIVLVVAAAVAAAIFLPRAMQEGQRRERRRRDLADFRSAPLQPLQFVDVMVEDGETFYYAGVAEWDAHRVGAGQLDTFRTGGMLYLSDRRLIFIGSGVDERMPFGCWKRVEEYQNGFRLHFTKNVMTIYSEDPLLLPIFRRIAAGQVNGSRRAGDPSRA